MLDFQAINWQEEVNIPLTLGHLFLAWHTLSQHFSDLRKYAHLSEAERRAIWGLEDALGAALSKQGLGEYSDKQEKQLLEQASKLIATLHIKCLD